MSELSHVDVARRAVPHARERICGSRALAEKCGVAPEFVDAALAPLVDAGKLLRTTAFRNGAAEFDYRWSSTWVPTSADFAMCAGGGIAPIAAISPVAPATPTRLAPAAPPEPIPAHALRPAATPRAASWNKGSFDEPTRNSIAGGATKAANRALDRALAQSPQSLGWALAPTPAPEPEAEAHPTANDANQENAMQSRTRKPRTTNSASPQFQLCALLMAKGDLTREEMAAALNVEPKQLYNAIYTAKSLGRIVFIEKNGKFRITAEGKTWTSGGANLDNQKATGSSPREVKRSRRQAREESASLPKHEKNRLGVIDVKANGTPKKSTALTFAPIQVVEECSFRCAVFSDGGFHLAKDGQSIDLTAVEHAQMLRYLERMAEQQA